jgi:hypothetical protein
MVFDRTASISSTKEDKVVRRCVLTGVAQCLDLCLRICITGFIHDKRIVTQAEAKQLDAKSGTGIAEDTRYRLRLLVREALDGNNNIAALSKETAAYLYGTKNRRVSSC